VTALATAIQRVIREPGLKERLVEGGTSSYEARFTKAVFIRESLRILRARPEDLPRRGLTSLGAGLRSARGVPPAFSPTELRGRSPQLGIEIKRGAATL